MKKGIHDKPLWIVTYFEKGKVRQKFWEGNSVANVKANFKYPGIHIINVRKA